jgi:hypothetical protein
VRLQAVASFLNRFGYEVIATSIDVDAVATLSRETHADVALVGLGLDSEHALQMITNIVREAACPSSP